MNPQMETQYRKAFKTGNDRKFKIIISEIKNLLNNLTMN